MKFLAVALVGFGLVGMYAFYLGVIKGEIKWEADRPLTGTEARTMEFVALVAGLLMIAAGGYVAFEVLNG